METVNVQKCGEAFVSARNIEIKVNWTPHSKRTRVLFINKEQLQKVLDGEASSVEIVRLIQ